jgi:5-methylcytosine-specific restriction protein A
MATRQRLCLRHGHIPVGPCKQCQAERDQQRPSPWQRGYNAHWRRLREAALAAHPSCVACGSTVDLHVDHIDPARKGDPELTLNDVQVLCGYHNRVKSGPRRAQTAPNAPESTGEGFSPWI